MHCKVLIVYLIGQFNVTKKSHTRAHTKAKQIENSTHLMWCIVKYGRRYILYIQVVSFMLHSLRTPNKDFVVIHLDERHTNKMHSLTVVTVIYHTCVEQDSCAGSFYFFISFFAVLYASFSVHCGALHNMFFCANFFEFQLWKKKHTQN